MESHAATCPWACMGATAKEWDNHPELLGRGDEADQGHFAWPKWLVFLIMDCLDDLDGWFRHHSKKWFVSKIGTSFGGWSCLFHMFKTATHLCMFTLRYLSLNITTFLTATHGQLVFFLRWCRGVGRWTAASWWGFGSKSARQDVSTARFSCGQGWKFRNMPRPHCFAHWVLWHVGQLTYGSWRLHSFSDLQAAWQKLDVEKKGDARGFGRVEGLLCSAAFFQFMFLLFLVVQLGMAQSWSSSPCFVAWAWDGSHRQSSPV